MTTESESSSLYSQKPATSPYPEPTESNPPPSSQCKNISGASVDLTSQVPFDIIYWSKLKSKIIGQTPLA